MSSIFVSYARRDNDLHALRTIEQTVAQFGEPYIDDLHHERFGTDRHEIVETALSNATIFVAIVTPHYLSTPWTRKEFAVAIARGLPIRTLLPAHHPHGATMPRPGPPGEEPALDFLQQAGVS